jgi:hypothetical protein
LHAAWGDAWRGLGACVAILWFALPLPVQARTVAALRGRATRADRDARDMLPAGVRTI